MAYWTADPNYKEALEIQARLMAVVRDSAADTAAVVQAARAWVCIQDQKRIFRGRFKPGNYGPRDMKRAPSLNQPTVELLPEAETSPVVPPVPQPANADVSDAEASQ